MKRWIVLLAATALIGMAAGTALAGDTLADIKSRGVLVVGVKDSTVPFGFVDEQTRQIIGYDVDICKAFAEKLGVKLEVKAVTSASRMPQLTEGNVDLIAATMTKTPERAQQIDFSYAYFLTGQKFLVKKGAVKALSDLEGKKIGTAKGSTSEQNVSKALPKATILSFDDYPQAFLALQQGKVFAVTTDESILAGIRGSAPNKEQFEIPAEIRISDEPYGIGMRKGDKALVDFVNATLLEMEKNGKAKDLFVKWFGPGSKTPMERTFTISPEK
jgi:polar amino acid transport system substrate-binding protein